ncbi:magnesium transporter [Methylocella silvestris BL2]|uniref:Magnesium transporter MgtE n=1 Tax=Methylocella silvestris (strain DSM 15510 / CIP 108128 / LMG 27833 / NCIMB 13906 / BL2) TaxID=395965 RepID=B8EP79_METSB|nr:magnesium transporter [Methylocella silvestris]ACK49667.1 magnesium transporter [Methylocella silvestris BL2]
MAELYHEEPNEADDSIYDEDGGVRADFLEEVKAAIEANDGPRVTVLAGALHEADLGALIVALEPEERLRLVRLMGTHFDFAALTEIDDNIRDEILEGLPAREVAEGVRDLENDDAVTLLEDLEPEEQAEILDALSPVDRAQLQRSLDYPDHSAGRLMQTTFVTAPPYWTAGQAIDVMRDTDEADLPDSFYEVFIVDPGHRLLGTVFLDTLLRSKSRALLEDIMSADRRRVEVTEDREEVARLFQRYNLVSAPVVDEGDRLVGVITIDDVVDVIQEEADANLKALGGVSESEELSDTVFWTAKSRFVWLLVNLLTAFIASSVLGLFEGSLQKMVALAVLAPIVASQGGNAATQTMTVAVRALATRELSRANAARIILREVLVGAVNGVGFGILTGVIAGYWFGSPSLGVVIALAMVTNLVAGALGGILIPQILAKFHIDPAVASGAFVTTVTDVVGFTAFLGFATVWFRLG